MVCPDAEKILMVCDNSIPSCIAKKTDLKHGSLIPFSSSVSPMRRGWHKTEEISNVPLPLGLLPTIQTQETYLTELDTALEIDQKDIDWQARHSDDGDRATSDDAEDECATEVEPPSESADIRDVNGDGVINILDLVAVANGFGKTEPDINGDGIVNILDLVVIAKELGT